MDLSESANGTIRIFVLDRFATDVGARIVIRTEAARQSGFEAPAATDADCWSGPSEDIYHPPKNLGATLIACCMNGMVSILRSDASHLTILPSPSARPKSEVFERAQQVPIEKL